MRKHKKFQRKKIVFFTISSFSEKLFFIFFSLAVKKPLLIVKNFKLFVLALLENKLCTMAQTPKNSIPLYYILNTQNQIYYTILRQQKRKIYVEVSKDFKLLHYYITNYYM